MSTSRWLSARGGDVDHHLAGHGLRVGHVLHAQDVQASELVKDDRLHSPPPPSPDPSLCLCLTLVILSTSMPAARVRPLVPLRSRERRAQAPKGAGHGRGRRRRRPRGRRLLRPEGRGARGRAPSVLPDEPSDGPRRDPGERRGHRVLRRRRRARRRSFGPTCSCCRRRRRRPSTRSAETGRRWSRSSRLPTGCVMPTRSRRGRGSRPSSSEPSTSASSSVSSSATDGLEILFARSKAVLDSAAARIRAPIDRVWTDVRDGDGLEADARFARSLGFRGKACIHPDQVEIVNRVFTPSDEELTQARRVDRGVRAGGRRRRRRDGPRRRDDRPACRRAGATGARARGKEPCRCQLMQSRRRRCGVAGSTRTSRSATCFAAASAARSRTPTTSGSPA